MALLADGGVRAWGRDDSLQVSRAPSAGPAVLVAAGSGETVAIAGEPPPACPADLNRDGTVTGADLGILLGAWGTDGGSTGADLNGDGNVSGADLGILLGAWGPCP